MNQRAFLFTPKIYYVKQMKVFENHLKYRYDLERNRTKFEVMKPIQPTTFIDFAI